MRDAMWHARPETPIGLDLPHVDSNLWVDVHVLGARFRKILCSEPTYLTETNHPPDPAIWLVFPTVPYASKLACAYMYRAYLDRNVFRHSVHRD